jgi:dimethylargininase
MAEAAAWVALTRAVPASVGAGELTHLERTPIDVERARAQHAAYEQALVAAGCAVMRLAELPGLPDSVFVEDAAVVLDEVAVLTRPGAVSRRPEVDALVPALSAYRALVRIAAPATLDGGDVLRLGRTMYVGMSARSTADGAAALERLLAPLGYEVRPVALQGALHLKTAVTEVADGLLLVNPDWVDPAAFPGFDCLPVDPREPFAANALRVVNVVIHSTEHPRTQELLRARGIAVLGVDASELGKAEGGVTCSSLIIAARPGGAASPAPAT